MIYQRVTTLGDALWAQKSAHSGGRTDPMDLSATTMVKTNGKAYAGYKSKPDNQKRFNLEGIKCFKCGKFGHLKRNCDQKKLQMISNAGVDQQSAGSSGGQNIHNSKESEVKTSQVRQSIVENKDFR